MNSSTQPHTEHQNIWELLPWFVNGRLSESDMRRVEAHMRVCGDCRNEYAAQRQICQVIASDVIVEQIPTAGLNKLRLRIEHDAASKERVAEVADTTPAPVPRRVGATIGWRSRVNAMAASVGAIFLAFGVVAMLHSKLQLSHAADAYYTVTVADQQPKSAVIRAVFDQTVNLSELQSLLDDAQLRIVAGPTEAGVYSLAMNGPQSIDWSLLRLRRHRTVRFAEAIGAAPVSKIVP